MKKLFKGFTLAEVLITLGIIGVVAAMTIPTLMVNLRAEKLKSQFEKTYADLNVAIVFRTLLKSVFAKFNRYVWLCV